MALKDILVVIDEGQATAARLSYCASLAQRHDAHITGVFAVPHPDVPGYVMAQMPEEVRRSQAEAARARTAEARAAFESAMAAADLSGRSEWRSTAGEPTSSIAMMGRYSDLIAIGQTEAETPDYPTVDPAELVLSSGRPVLVIPYAFRANGIGKHVLVAWNGSREAARAVSDAMPILEAAARVSVLAVDPGGALGDAPGADIALHLARHGITVDASQMESQGLDASDILLNRVADLSVDMIVMGGYGRSRLRELVLGGVTRDILHHMTVPVLMSH